MKKIFKSRIRFIISTVLSLIAFCLNLKLSTIEKCLLSYNVFQWSYLFLLLHVVLISHSETIKKRALEQDESALFVLLISVVSSLVVLFGIALELSSAKEVHGLLKMIHLVLPAITLIGVWLLLPMLFAIHYAHLYYLNEIPPMKFPDNPKNPNYWDFLYFSVTIAVASQTADVAVNSRTGRKLVLLQSVMAFIFNTSVLALGINVAASLLS